MFAYHLRLGLKSLRRNPVLTALMIGAIGLGIGVCLTTLNVYSLVSGNPLASRNNITYAVQMDGWDPNEPMDKKRPELAPFELTYRDAQAVFESDVPDRKVIMRKGAFVLGSSDEKSETKPYNVLARLTTPDFFAMFSVPFRYGSGWDAEAESNAEPVIVLGEEANQKFLAAPTALGKPSNSTTRNTRVLGVLDHWSPVPKFYDLNNGSLDEPEEVFMPYSRGALLEVVSAGNTNCWKPEPVNSFQEFLNSECVWVQSWVELDSPAKVSAFRVLARWLCG